MKNLKLFFTAACSLFLLQASAQTEAPKGFSKGKVVLLDKTTVNGLLKDQIRKNASVILLAEGKEKKYDGADIVSVEIEGVGYTCIKGDFFKEISTGELAFLQKSSNASSKPTQVGSDVLFISGTAGKIGDYFIYENKNQQLKLVSKKNLEVVVAESFAGYTPAIEKAKAAQADIARLKDAVESYNNRGGK